jgi:hypothetical protein
MCTDYDRFFKVTKVFEYLKNMQFTFYHPTQYLAVKYI